MSQLLASWVSACEQRGQHLSSDAQAPALQRAEELAACISDVLAQHAELLLREKQLAVHVFHCNMSLQLI